LEARFESIPTFVALPDEGLFVAGEIGGRSKFWNEQKKIKCRPRGGRLSDEVM
jgi:hypothetical protein